jgi:cell division protein FtsB
MKLCDEDHDEICYEGPICPVCEKYAEVERLQRETEDLREEIKELQEGS